MNSTLNTGAFEFATFLFCRLSSIDWNVLMESGSSFPRHVGPCFPCGTMYQSRGPLILWMGGRSSRCNSTTRLCETSDRLSEGKSTRKSELIYSYSKHLYTDFY
jgi:hypothetical protein